MEKYDLNFEPVSRRNAFHVNILKRQFLNLFLIHLRGEFCSGKSDSRIGQCKLW
jgi:hypothetical protein